MFRVFSQVWAFVIEHPWASLVLLAAAAWLSYVVAVGDVKRNV